MTYTILTSLIGILTSILGAYFFLIIARFFIFRNIRRMTSKITYKEEKYEPSEFEITTPKNFNFLIPLSQFQIKIKRTNSVDDGMNWNATLYSDMIGISHFQGAHITEKPIGKNNKDGWMDVYFSHTENKIAIKLHYISDDRRWIENEGYFIIKK